MTDIENLTSEYFGSILKRGIQERKIASVQRTSGDLAKAYH